MYPALRRCANVRSLLAAGQSGGRLPSSSSALSSTMPERDPFLNGTNSAYVEEMYLSWQRDPQSVHAVSVDFFTCKKTDDIELRFGIISRTVVASALQKLFARRCGYRRVCSTAVIASDGEIIGGGGGACRRESESGASDVYRHADWQRQYYSRSFVGAGAHSFIPGRCRCAQLFFLFGKNLKPPVSLTESRA